MGRSVIADRILLPWVNLFLSAPLTALVPVIMVIFGLGETTIIMTVILFAIWIIVLDARAGVRSIAPSLVEMSQVFGASRSEEHTSELQSLMRISYAVFCLKKKNNHQNIIERKNH